MRRSYKMQAAAYAYKSLVLCFVHTFFKNHFKFIFQKLHLENKMVAMAVL